MLEQTPENDFIRQVIEHCHGLEDRTRSSYIPSQAEGLSEHFAPPIGDSCCLFHAILAMLLNLMWTTRQLSSDLDLDIKKLRTDEEVQDQVNFVLKQTSTLGIRTIEAAHLMFLCGFVIMNDIASHYISNCPPDGVCLD